MASVIHNRRYGESRPKPNKGIFQPPKILFRMYQAHHHLKILRLAEENDDHPLFMGKVKELDNNYFKVAGASDDHTFLADTRRANRVWRNTQIQNQIRHYERMIEFEKGALSAGKLSKFEMNQNLNTANLWARKNFRKKFNSAEFSKVERIAATYISDVKGDTTPLAQRPTKTRPTDTGKSSTPRIPRKRPTSAPTGEDDSWKTPRPTRKRLPESSPETSPTYNHNAKQRKGDSVRVRPGSPSCGSMSAAANIDFGLGPGQEFGSRFRALENVSDVTTPSGAKRKRPVGASPTSPNTPFKKGRQERTGNNESSPSVRPVRASAKNKNSSQTSPSQKQNLVFEDRRYSVGVSPTAPNTPSKKDRQECTENNDSSPSGRPVRASAKNKYSSQTSPSQKQNIVFEDRRQSRKIPFKTSKKVEYFPKLADKVKGKKVVDHWQIPKITKPVLALGTSNFNRIENVDRDDAQIISYSGMKFDHLIKMLDSFKFGPESQTPGMQPAHVVFMAGLNDMRLSKCTNKTNISRLYSAARKQFPNSKISFCQVPMKKNKFTNTECETIDDLNCEIKIFCERHKVNCIPKIPFSDFEVDPADPIHWTPKCADKTIKHIFDNLN